MKLTDGDGTVIADTPSEFDEHLRVLNEKGYRVVKLMAVDCEDYYEACVVERELRP